MPKLIYFVACEKTLLEENTNNVTLISIFDTINAVKPPEGKDTQIAMTWNAVSQWVHEDGDEEKTFQQKTHILAPNHKTYAEAIIEFTLPKYSHRNNINIFGFPVMDQGIYLLKLFFKQSINDEWMGMAEYPITVNHIEPPPKRD